MPIPLILGGAALLGTGALGVGGARLLKDELGFDEYGAAQQELQQGTKKGYNPKTGQINRGLVERFGDALMGNDPTEILRQTKDAHKENLTQSRTGTALLDARPGFEITSRMTQNDIDREYRKTTKVDPIISDIFATGEVNGKYTREQLQGMDPTALQGILRKMKIAERTTLDETNPATIRQIAATERAEERYQSEREESNKRFNATQQLAISQLALGQQQQANQMQIAQMNNQLQMRRQDSADRRADRRDRQAYIQQLMAGLSTLGASLAI